MLLLNALLMTGSSCRAEAVVCACREEGDGHYILLNASCQNSNRPTKHAVSDKTTNQKSSKNKNN